MILIDVEIYGSLMVPAIEFIFNFSKLFTRQLRLKKILVPTEALQCENP